MLDPRQVSDHFDDVRAALLRRSEQAAAQLDAVKPLLEQRRQLVGRTESLQQERNKASEEMGELARKGDKAAMAARREALKTLSAQVKDLETELSTTEKELEDQLLAIPNAPHPSAPDGKTEHDNPVLRHWGDKPKFDFKPLSHWELGEKLGILDQERASKLSGSRFSVLYGLGARLERALAAFMLDLHTRDHGYTEVWPPYLVRAEALRGTGNLPKFEADLFKTGRGDPNESAPLYLIPTAEVPVTNLHADEILDAESLPIAYCAYTPCFRSEAGSYGRDMRGIIRQHQFDKVELVRFTTPEKSLEELDLLTRHAEEILKRLGLHYRVVEHVPVDLGASAAKGYDLEVWLPSEETYREISSCSNFWDYQARRAKIRYRPSKDEKPRLVHTINGSGLAIGRTWVAILEQYQQADGSVVVPEVLRDFVGTDRIRGRA